MLGRYELVRALGRGGMAEVYLARRRGPRGVEKRLAIKRIRRERAADPRLLELFVAEARLSMAMVHRNIVPMFDFGRVGDELFLVMEYVDGADLGEALRCGRRHDHPIPAAVAGYVAMEACQALHYAHTPRGDRDAERGVVHRDVNPHNVLLSYTGEVKLMDFGVATTETDLGHAGKVRGTPAYMAPEQARGLPVDPRADVFALGLVLWEALAGRRAYPGDDVVELLAVARNGAVPALPDQVPARLRHIVATATASDLAERYPSARAMQLDLDDYLVDVRAGDARTSPLDHQLSAWLRAVCPPAGNGDGAVEVAAPAGRVVTFLDQGEAEVEHWTPSSLGHSTLASMAETVAEDEAAIDSSPDSEREAEQPASVARQRPPARWARAVLLLLIAGALTAGGVLLAARRGRAPATTEVAPAAPGPGPAVSPPADRAPPVIARRPVAAAPAGPAEAKSPPVPGPRTGSGGEERTPVTPVEHKPPRTPVSASPHRAPAPPAEPPPSSEPGTVRVSSAPWASVEVEGHDARCTETPCSLRLPAGSYVLLLRNPVAELEKRIEVEVTAGRTTDVVATLTRSR